MKAKFAQLANAGLTLLAKKMTFTNCYWVCHAPEAPEELFR